MNLNDIWLYLNKKTSGSNLFRATQVTNAKKGGNPVPSQMQRSRASKTKEISYWISWLQGMQENPLECKREQTRKKQRLTTFKEKSLNHLYLIYLHHYQTSILTNNLARARCFHGPTCIKNQHMLSRRCITSQNNL